MTSKEYIIEFERKIKEYKFINLVKNKEKNKLIYDIEGMDVNDHYIPYIKFIFFFNSDMTEFAESSLLYSDGHDIKTIAIADVKDIFETIIKDDFINLYSDFIFNFIDNINKVSKDILFDNFKQVSSTNKYIIPVDKKYLSFELESINTKHLIQINVSLSNMIFNNNEYVIDDINKVYEYIIKNINKQ